MPRTKTLGTFVVTLCLMAASTAMAQGQGGPRGGGRMFGRGGFRMGYAMLIQNEKVQEELALSADQKEKVTALREEFRGAGGGNFRDLSEEEREKRRTEMRQRTDEQNKKVEAILSADQNRRLKEISLWLRGHAALGDEEVARELSLSDEQKEQVKTIEEESGKQMAALFGGGRGRGGEGGGGGEGGRGANREKMAQIQKDTDEEYLAVLTPEQKSKFEQMKGAKPAIEREDLFRFGGRRGQGPGGEGRGQRRGGNNDN